MTSPIGKTRVALRRVSLRSLAEHGCLLGTVAAALPSLLCGLFLVWLLSVVRRWLESWQELTISLLGRVVAQFDLVQFLHLEKLLESLNQVSPPVLLLFVLALCLLAGVVLAVMVVVVGLAYNLLATATGGLVVEARFPDDTKQR